MILQVFFVFGIGIEDALLPNQKGARPSAKIWYWSGLFQTSFCTCCYPALASFTKFWNAHNSEYSLKDNMTWQGEFEVNGRSEWVNLFKLVVKIFYSEVWYVLKVWGFTFVM